MIQSDQVNDLFTAIAKAQGEMSAVPFDKKNPHYNSAYASLSATQEMVRAPLAKHNLAIVQSVSYEENNYYLETRLVHGSGQWISDKIKLMIDRQNMQGLGSAVTYAKRYTLQAILGICGDEDDDGNGAAGKPIDNELKKEKKPSEKPKNVAPGAQNSPEPKKILNDPALYKIPKGIRDDLEGKMVKEINEHTLKAIVDWCRMEMKKTPRPKNFSLLTEVGVNITQFLKSVGIE